MSYNGSGTFQINTSGQPVVAGTVISATAFNALTADLATGLSTAITKDGQTTTTARIPFAAGINSTLTTDSSSVSTGSIITAGGVGVAKNLYVGVNANVAGTLGVTGVATFSAAPIYSSLTASSAVATDASKGLVSVTNTGTGNNVLGTSPTITTPTISSLSSAAATALTLQSAGTTAITVDTSQNVGIGTSSPTNYGAGTTTLSISNSTGSGYLDLYNAGSRRGYQYATASTYNIGTTTSTALVFETVGSERMRIDSSGNVGIGTSSPGTRLDVVGSGNPTITLRGSDAAYTGTLNIQSAGGGISVINGTGGLGGLSFQTGGSERARITSAGAVLVGTTSQINAGLLNLAFDTGTYCAIATRPTNNTGYDAARFFNSSTTQIGSIACTTTNTSYVTSSDYRLKNTIAPMTGALARVAALKPCTYKWNVDGLDGQGFIAHELQEVCPDAVTGEKDGEQMQGVDYGKLTPILTAALQEAIAKIETLEARISALEAK